MSVEILSVCVCVCVCMCAYVCVCVSCVMYWCMMYWCMMYVVLMYDVCVMCDVWCMMYDVWCMMYDVWCMMYVCATQGLTSCFVYVLRIRWNQAKLQQDWFEDSSKVRAVAGLAEGMCFLYINVQITHSPLHAHTHTHTHTHIHTYIHTYTHKANKHTYVRSVLIRSL